MAGRNIQTHTINEVAARFESWRRTRQGKASIPDELWSVAVEVARREGLNRTATRLRLEWNELKRRMTFAGTVSRQTAPPAFMELIAPLTESRQDCMIELEGGRGKMRIHLKGTTAPDLASLSRALWDAAL